MSRGPDFLRPVARPGTLAWAWCATGLLVLAVAVADAAAAWAGRQQAVLSAQVAARPARTVAPAPRRDGRTPAALPDAAAAQQVAAQSWLQQLAHPWPQVWAASEAASEPGIAWLVLEHSLQGALRLEGLAPDEGPAQRAAQLLRDGTGTADAAGPRWQDVALVRVERVAGGQRFEISARLGPGPASASASPPAAAPAASAGAGAATAAGATAANNAATATTAAPLGPPSATAVAAADSEQQVVR